VPPAFVGARAFGSYLFVHVQHGDMVQMEGSVCCCRCGVHLFPFDKKDPALLTLPLYWEGKRVFKKTALRCTVVQDMGGTYLFRDKLSKKYPADPEVLRKHHELAGLISPLLPDHDIVVSHVVRYGFTGAHEENLKSISDIDFYRALYREAGATFYLVPFPETAEAFRAMGTQDFALLLHCQKDFNSFLAWTDFNAEYLEPCLMSLWLLTGGNLLFGDWGRPRGTEKKVGPPDLDVLAAKAVSYDRVATNNQAAFSSLVRRGHYLGYWPAGDEQLSGTVCEKVRRAVSYQLLYPRWLFLHDFPPSQFDNLRRRSGLGGQGFSGSAEDFVVPRMAAVAAAEDKPVEPTCNVL